MVSPFGLLRIGHGARKGHPLPEANPEAYFSHFWKQVTELVRNLRRAMTPKAILLIVIVVLILIILGRNLKNILLVLALGLAASYSTIYKRSFRVPSAVELVTFGTVITGIAYGPVVGAAFGVITTFSSEIISSGIDVFTIFYAFARAITGVVSFYLGGLGMVPLGMIGVGIFNVICQPIYQLSGDVEARFKGIYYLIVNTLFNLMVFYFLGNFFRSLALM
jgi:hypothetical protein